MWPHRRQPTRLCHPWDSPGKNTGVGCHFLLQCVEVRRESEVAQSYPTLCDPMDYSPPGSSIHGICQARVLEWGAITFSLNSFISPTNFTSIDKYIWYYPCYCHQTTLTIYCLFCNIFYIFWPFLWRKKLFPRSLFRLHVCMLSHFGHVQLFATHEL